MNCKIIVGLVVAAYMSGGCAGTKVHFADAPVEKLDLSRGRRVMARSSGLHLFGLIPIGINSRQANAYKLLQEESMGDYLTDITIQDSWKFVFIGSKYGTTITATAYPDKSLSPTPPGGGLTQKLDELKALYERGELSVAEYESSRKKALGN